MGERAPYSRVYWSVRDDPRLTAIYPDDHHLATWLRLLLAADMAWPAPADVPGSVRKASLAALEAAGIVEVLPSGLFRFHGLDTERGRRRDAAATSSGHRWDTGRTPDGDRSDTRRNASRAKTSQDETSHAPAREGLPNLTTTVAEAWSTASGRTPLSSGAFALEYLDDACRRHDEARILEAITEARGTFNGSIPSTQQLAAAVRSILDPLPSKVTAQKLYDDQEQIRHRRSVENTKRQAHETGWHETEPSPGCPLCEGVPA